MAKGVFAAIETWAMRSKPRAFGFLFCLALSVSAGFTGAAMLLAMIASRGLLPFAVASTP